MAGSAQRIVELIFKTTKQGDAPKEVGVQLTELKTGLSGAIENLTGLSMSSLTVAGAIAGVGAAIKGSIDDTMEYASQVRDLGRISGTSAEETSKLIQVADDLTVEYGTLQQAAKALAQQGIALTTEELAKLSDEYLKIPDAGARAEFAFKTFGRAGEEMAKILEQGGDAIRKMADAQSGALILTEDQIKKARELEVAQDELNDTFEGFKVIIGTAVIPVITDLIKGIMGIINAEDLLKQRGEAVVKTAEEEARTYEDYATAIARAAEADGLMIDAEGNLYYEAVSLRDEYGNAIETVKKVVKEKAALTAEEWRAREATRVVTEQVAASDAAMKAMAEAANGASTGIVSVTNASKENKTQLDLVTQSMNAVTKEMLFQKAAAGLDAEAALALGQSMGVIKNESYWVLSGLQKLRDEYDANHDGLITAAEGADEYRRKVLELAGAYQLLPREIRIKIVQEIQSTYTGWNNPVYIPPGGLPIAQDVRANEAARTTGTMGTGGMAGAIMPNINVTINSEMDYQVWLARLRLDLPRIMRQ